MKRNTIKMLLVACAFVSAYSVRAEVIDAVSAKQLQDAVAQAIQDHKNTSAAHLYNLPSKIAAFFARAPKAAADVTKNGCSTVANGCTKAATDCKSMFGCAKDAVVGGCSSAKNGCVNGVACLNANKKTIALVAVAAAAATLVAYVAHQYLCPAVNKVSELEAQIAQEEATKAEETELFAL